MVVSFADKSQYGGYQRYLDAAAASIKNWELEPQADGDIQDDMSNEECVDGIPNGSDPVVNLIEPQSMATSQANPTPTHGSILDAAMENSIEPAKRNSQSMSASKANPTSTHCVTLDASKYNSIKPAQRSRQDIVFNLPGWVPVIATEDDKVKWRMEAEKMPLNQLKSALQRLRDEDETNRSTRDGLELQLCLINDQLTLNDAKLAVFQEVEEAGSRRNSF